MSKHVIVYTRPNSNVIEEKEFPSYEEAAEFFHRISGLGWTSYYTSACVLRGVDRQMSTLKA
jgi:hypothetical protein